MRFTAITACRSCGSESLELLLDLGEHPLANSLKRSIDETESRFPLTLLFCSRCSLVQIRETVDKEILFGSYIWVTGTSALANDYAEEFCSKAIDIQKPSSQDLIVEIASNDGTFLKPFLKRKLNAIGVDPAENIAALANERGIKTLCRFWSRKTAEDVVSEYGRAKLCFARNVIPHVSDLHDVVSGIHHCLDTEGVGMIEFHYGGKILSGLQYDSIYHEHLCYFSLKTMEHLLHSFDLYPFHVEWSPISGGACVVSFSKTKKGKSPAYQQFQDEEDSGFVNSFDRWKAFAKSCITHREKSAVLLQLHGGDIVVGFGASARSSTYLNFCGFSRENIKAIIDNNKLKQGLFSAGSSIPIVSIKDGLAMKPDLLFVLAWNFREEIIESCRKQGYQNSFMLPFPAEPRIET